MGNSIIEFGQLSDAQKDEAVQLFLYGFGHFMTFSKDEALKKKLFIEIFSPNFFLCYVEEDKVLGLMGLGTNKVRPIDFKKDICQKYFGKFKGSLISKQMNGIFQKQAVKDDNELYLDTLVTHPDYRKMGIGTKLINKTSSFGEYTVLVTEVFSKNENAINFYIRNGFTIIKKHKFSIMRLFGSGYPIVMVKELA
ncbi:MAG: GNAT family N-acetyltransferase [Bacilli bacterium]|nr:GNAT family N-acetyltransferase [Bacilli bacterium]